MRSLRILWAGVLLLIIAAGALAQGTPQHFVKEGLSFDYPTGWTISDASNSDAQDLSLGRADSDAQIKVFVHRGKVDTPEKIAQAKTKIVDPYLTYMEKQVSQMGKTERLESSAEIGSIRADGVRIRITDSDPGEARIYWTTLNNRLMIVTLFGPDKALKEVEPTWEMIRSSLKVEPPPPKTGPKKP